MLYHNVDYAPYEGLEVTGWSESVLSRGSPVGRNQRAVRRHSRPMSRNPLRSVDLRIQFIY
jgi:dihydropyrimidinase